MSLEGRLRRILVSIAVAAYAVAAVSDVVLAFSPDIDATHATAAAFVMIVGIGVTLFFWRQEDFMGGSLFKGRSPVVGFASGMWISLVLATAGGLYPVLGAGRFISFMGYVGSIAFIPPVVASVVLTVADRIRGANRK